MNKECLRDIILGITQCVQIETIIDVQSITIKGGQFKDSTPEEIDITLETGSITSIVGPTGSGKSRLLADLEWMAQGDTHTKREILIKHSVPDSEHAFTF